MCYFLYGAINDGINSADYEKVAKNYDYHFNIGDVQSVDACVENISAEYRITVNHCDCDTALGQRNINEKQLETFKELFVNLQTVRGVKYVLLSKNWANETNTRHETIHINDMDILHFLANIEDNCLYKIELYKKNY